MARRTNRPITFPSWAQTVGAMAEHDCKVRVNCDLCAVFGDVDIPALLQRVGPDYSLIDRRCRCRLTPDCQGWNRFLYYHAVFRPLWTDEAIERWWVKRLGGVTGISATGAICRKCKLVAAGGAGIPSTAKLRSCTGVGEARGSTGPRPRSAFLLPLPRHSRLCRRSASAGSSAYATRRMPYPLECWQIITPRPVDKEKACFRAESG